MKEAKQLFKTNLITCAVALGLNLLIFLVGFLGSYWSLKVGKIAFLAYLVCLVAVRPLMIIISAFLTYKSFLTYNDDPKRNKFILGNILCTVGLVLLVILYHV